MPGGAGPGWGLPPPRSLWVSLPVCVLSVVYLYCHQSACGSSHFTFLPSPVTENPPDSPVMLRGEQWHSWFFPQPPVPQSKFHDGESTRAH